MYGEEERAMAYKGNPAQDGINAARRDNALTELAQKAIEIYSAHEEGADMDAGFDAGEFSGPAHDRMAKREIQKLAADSGFTVNEIESEVARITNNKGGSLEKTEDRKDR
jgi:hypothetical protein